MRIWIALILLLFSSAVWAADKALILNVDGPVTPAVQDYIQRGIGYAETEKAAIIILQLDTPGGLDASMRGIDQAIITSPIPVITYVAPAGARAASAGVYIMYASHLAVMSSGTNIGAASPVNLLAVTNPSQMSTEDKKVINDAAAYLRSLAELRGRNVDWAELAVRQAASISANEAEKLKVIDAIADSYPQLLNVIDGHTVTVQGKLETLHTKNLQIENMEQDWRYQFLSFITDPNVAYLLMLIAIYGLFFELSNPGLVLPGVVGVIALLLVLYAFQLMPINYAGLTLLVIGIAFMIFEVYASSFGVIGIGGVIAFILGSILLFDTHDPFYHLAWTLIISMSIVSMVFFFMVLTLAIRSHQKAIVTGQEGLINNEGVVLSVMNEQISVRVLGEIWDARSSHKVHTGEKIKVIAVQGLKLIVEPLKTQHKS